MSILVRGVEGLALRLRVPLDAATTATAVAIAQALRAILSPYPPQRPPVSPRRWYVRGYGPRWLRKDGSTGGRQTSQTMNRRWQVRQKPQAARLVNFASYSGWVHGAQQTRRHQQAGWVALPAALDTLERRGTVRQIVERALRRLLGRV